MKKWPILFLLFIFQNLLAEEKHNPDTVSVGVYINSVHNINFKDKEYTISMWLWLKYKNPEFDFSKYLEVPMAKSVDKSFYTVDTLDDGRIYMLMKLQCVMKDNWKIGNFPFDKQKLRFSIENSQYASDELVFSKDTVGQHYSKWTMSGWTVIPDSFKITTGIKKYETAFGDPSMTPHSEFANYKIMIGIERESWWLFLKLFLGMYIAFLLSFLSFFIHRESVESRFNLTVGSLFAVIGNKYVVDSALPEGTSFTLVDSLHGITLLFIFASAMSSVYCLKLLKANNTAKLVRFDRISSWALTIVYFVLNFWLVLKACTG